MTLTQMTQMNAEEDRTFLCGICVNLRSLRSLLVWVVTYCGIR